MSGPGERDGRLARAAVAILTVWILTACAATFQPTPDGVGATDESPPFELSELFVEESNVEIEGSIVEILESFPPQLVVESERGRFSVQLADDTRVSTGAESGSFADLSVGARVRLSLRETETSPQVLEVELLDTP